MSRKRRISVIIALGLLTICSAAIAQPPPPAPYFGVADLDGNVRVDGRDFGLFVQYWTAYQEHGILNQKADFDGNGAIDFNDAARFVQEWLKTEITRVQSAAEPREAAE